MRLRYVGPGAGGVTRRLIGRHEWSTRTGYVADVEAELAASLLTQPEREFAVAPDEPLLALASGVQPADDWAAMMALAGVGILADLAALDGNGLERLAKETGASLKQVRAWAAKARQGIKIREEVEF